MTFTSAVFPFFFLAVCVCFFAARGRGQAAVLAAFGSLLLWTLAGLAAIVLGILALLRRSGIARSVVAIVLAVLAPSLTTAVLLGTMALDISQL